MNEAPTELTPAIPAMFSKARGLLKKLKSAEDGPGVQECLPESETLSEDGGELQNEPALLPCPEDVQVLTTVSAEVRYKISQDISRFPQLCSGVRACVREYACVHACACACACVRDRKSPVI